VEDADGSMAALPKLRAFAAEMDNLKIIPVADLIINELELVVLYMLPICPKDNSQQVGMAYIKVSLLISNYHYWSTIFSLIINLMCVC